MPNPILRLLGHAHVRTDTKFEIFEGSQCVQQIQNSIRVVSNGRDPFETLVRDVMSKAPAAIHEDTSIEEALSHMRSGPFRRLPVVDSAGKLIGLISLDDILELLSEEFREIGQLVRREGPMSFADA